VFAAAAEVFFLRDVFAAAAEVFVLRDTDCFFLAVGDLPRGAFRALRRGVGSSMWGFVRWVFAMMINK
jgi:hypothetical protein